MLHYDIILLANGIRILRFTHNRHNDNSTIGMLGSRIAVRAASRQVTRRNMATEPKMHKASDHWKNLADKRPVQHDDLHVSIPVVFDFWIPDSVPNLLCAACLSSSIQ